MSCAVMVMTAHNILIHSTVKYVGVQFNIRYRSVLIYP